MKKKLIIGAACMLVSTPAFAETNAWGGVSAGLNLDGGGVTIVARGGVDTSIGEGAFIGFGLGAGESGAKDCLGLACAYGGRELSAEARLGAVTKSGWKFYGLGGYSNLSVKIKSGALSITSYKDGGITGGLGFESALGDNTFLRTEFRYTDYGGGDHVTSVMPTIGFKF